ncbi:50S ribosomal protein L6 [Candidatus Kaiserbacteria bacterium RIFCSPHIGHO2_01_FULL_56_24]|uniref:Large ribosomal subunit protein uL6 n=1 Tax=Candidatus Kaiserbacteria bacterium RIFCSPHIGHO2_01_FULL_56_24 TaxID=1798487 RepID=A0A1F6D8I4_9BACT|nr:MAG: 50S ribosomal protein L6 [Candidatus Kaiserbacteria bacterium RIFCSPHIGHO2_01_FULL_56_24]
MSRIGKLAIAIPAGTEVSVTSDAIIVKGKGGTLTRSIHPAVKVAVADSNASVEPANNTRLAKALWGTYAAHVKNMINGVNTPFVKKLQVEGIGYKVEASGKNLKLTVGFSHPVLVAIPEGITAIVEKNVITVSGADKDAVGQFAASVREIKKPEPYKGKGIRYEGEVVRIKQGKKAAAAA